MSKLAIIILNYNRADLLAECLESIFRYPTSCTLDVWVVDNASSDTSVEMVQTRFPQAHLIVSSYNGGFAYGNNLALRKLIGVLSSSEAATHDVDPVLHSHQPQQAQDTPTYMLLLNNDTIVPPGTLDGLVDYLERHRDVGAVGPKVVLPDGSLDLACRRSFPTPMIAFYRMVGLSRLFPRSRRFGRYNLTYLDPNVEVDVDAVVGACMLVRTDVIREIGLLDERFFMYGEDLDWAYRMKQYGWRIVYYPAVYIVHHKRAASARRAVPSIRAFYAAMRIFHRKHFAATTPAPLNLLIEVGITIKEFLALGHNLIRPPAIRRVS